MMRDSLSRGSLIAVLVLIAASATAAEPGASKNGFVLFTPDARLRTAMPDIYVANAFGCAGGNTSPPLAWRNAPAGTKSFVVTLFDRDERSTPSGWWHWVVYDLPADTDRLPAGAGSDHSSALPAGALQGRTDLGTAAYHGPCPAKGDPPHRYLFTVYALNVAKLPVDAGASGAMVTSTVQDSLLGKATLVAHYGR
jgi:Raf kinase inhibitor-like YbhB/YbcL family protein